MSKPIVLTPSDWVKLRERLICDTNHADVLISWRSKAKFGFTVRFHEEFIPVTQSVDSSGKSKFRHSETVRLDFFDESKKTMFLLKYSDYFGKLSD